MLDTPLSPKPSSPSEPKNVSAKIEPFVLDAHALLVLLQKEKGQERVAELITQAQSGNASLHLSLINWGEISYITERERGEAFADELMRDLEKLPIGLAEVNRARVKSAVHIKAHYPVSYADAFAIALAQELGAAVVTGDPEFKAVEKVVSIFEINQN